MSSLKTFLERNLKMNVKSHNHQTSKMKFILPVLIITAFLVGSLVSKSFTQAKEDEGAIHMAKTLVSNTYTSYLFVEVPELDLEFSNVEATLVKKEGDESLGTYEVTGEVSYEEETYTFTSTISYYDGMYFPDGEVLFDE